MLSAPDAVVSRGDAWVCMWPRAHTPRNFINSFQIHVVYIHESELSLRHFWTSSYVQQSGFRRRRRNNVFVVSLSCKTAISGDIWRRKIYIRLHLADPSSYWSDWRMFAKHTTTTQLCISHPVYNFFYSSLPNFISLLISLSTRLMAVATNQPLICSASSAPTSASIVFIYHSLSPS